MLIGWLMLHARHLVCTVFVLVEMCFEGFQAVVMELVMDARRSGESGSRCLEHELAKAERGGAKKAKK